MAQWTDQIWILEDCEHHRSIYQEILELRYEIMFFPSIADLKNQFTTPTRPSLLIADMKLPDGNFLQLIQKKLIDLEGIPLLVVSGVADVDVLRATFDSGANDYITKPFNSAELIVKIERLRKTSADRHNRVLCENEIEKIRNELTSREFQIYSILAKQNGEALSRDQIEKKIWNEGKIGAKTLDVHIFNLRKKIREVDLDIIFEHPSSYVLKRSR